jgi:dUTPase
MYRNLEGGFIRDSVVKLSNCCGQIMPSLRIKPEVTWKKELSETERGEGGFGSSAS